MDSSKLFGKYVNTFHNQKKSQDAFKKVMINHIILHYEKNKIIP